MFEAILAWCICVHEAERARAAVAVAGISGIGYDGPYPLSEGWDEPLGKIPDSAIENSEYPWNRPKNASSSKEAAGGVAAPNAPPAKQPSTIHWHSDLNSAWTASERTGRPVYVHLTTIGCQPCRELERVLLANLDVIEALQDFECVTVEIRSPQEPLYGWFQRQGQVDRLVFPTEKVIRVHPYKSWKMPHLKDGRLRPAGEYAEMLRGLVE